MNNRKSLSHFCILALAGWTASVSGQDSPRLTEIQRLTNKEIALKLTGPVGLNYRIEASTNLNQWNGLVTLSNTRTDVSSHLDSAAAWLGQRFYRALQFAATNVVSGDHLVTDDGEVIIHPINHATFVMSWNGKMIYADPVGGSSRFQGLPRADLIFVTHAHSDHMDATTLTAVKGSSAVIFAPKSVYDALPASLKSITAILANGVTTNALGVSIEAVPMYNLTPDRLQYHAKGVGNGYVLTIGGKRIYISGDTEDFPEMRTFPDIDVAFICMNLPFTMTVQQAANAVRAFRPKIVYPYHFSSSNVNTFKQTVGTDLGIEVRLRTWY